MAKDYSVIKDVIESETLYDKMSKVYDEAYSQGYTDGFQLAEQVTEAEASEDSKAWKCAREICNMTDEQLKATFGCNIIGVIFDDHDPSEAMKRIENFWSNVSVGDELITTNGEKRKMVVTSIDEDKGLETIWNDGECRCYTTLEDLLGVVGAKKTGRNYPQIKEVIEKLNTWEW